MIENFSRQPKPELKRENVFFRFSDDPIYHDELTESLVKHLLSKINPKKGFFRALKSQIQTDKSLRRLISGDLDHLAHHLGDDPNIIYTKGVSSIDPNQRKKIAFNALFDQQILGSLELNNLTPEEVNDLRDYAENALSFFSTDEIETEENKTLQILSPKSINVITTWYTSHAYQDLEQVLIKLSDQPGGEKKIRSLALLGFLLGYLDDNHPNSQYNRILLYRYLNGELPKVVREKILLEENGIEDSKRLTKLKQYWHAVFVQKWVSSARLEYDRMGALTVPDRRFAQQSLAADVRSAETRSGALAQARSFYARTGNFELGERIVHDYDFNQLSLLIQEQRVKRNLQSFTSDLIREYNPEHKYFVDTHGKPVGVWRLLQEKTAQIFDVFMKVGGKLTSNEISKTEEQHLLIEVKEALISVLTQGDEKHKLNVTELFGVDFATLAPIEQCLLIIFTCLSLASPYQKPEKAVYLISHRLQQILNRHNDFIEKESIRQQTDWHFSIDEHQPAIEQARAKLADLKPEEGIISAQGEYCKQKIDLKHKLLTSFMKVLKEGNLGNVHIINSLILLFLTIPMLSMSLGEFSFKILTPIIATLANLPLFYITLRSKLAHEKIKEDLQKIQLLAQNFDTEIEKLKVPLSKKYTRVKVAFVTALLISFLAVPSIRSVSRLISLDKSDLAPLVLSLGEIIDELQIPDQIDQEELSSLKPKLRGIIYHLPENYKGNYGELIGYQTSIWLRPDSTLYTDEETLVFDTVEFVDNFDSTTHQTNHNQLVYEPESIGKTIYPLDGFKIVKVYQVGGEKPYLKDLGGLTYLGEKPERVLLVTEALNTHNLSENGEVRLVEGVKGETYQPWAEDWWGSRKLDKAFELYQQLSNDPILQRLHFNMVSEANDLVISFESEIIDYDQMVESYSELATKFSILFAKYVNTSRFYSLLYQKPDLDGPFSTLVGISNQPEAGYYCTVGNISFQEFMLSIGIRVLSKPGEVLKNYDGELLSRFGHMNSAVLLPNGKMLFTDMTPIRRNPGEDFSILDEKITEDDVKVPLAAKVGGALVASSGIYLAGKEIRKRRRKAFESKIDGFLPRDEIAANQVLKAVEHVLLYVLELADVNKAETLLENSFHPDRQALLSSLANDALTMISTESTSYTVNSAIKDTLIGYAKKLKRSKTKTDTNSSERLAIINKETRQSISHDLRFIWQEVKNQRKIKVNQINVEIAKINQDIAILQGSSEELLIQKQSLEKQLKEKKETLIRLENCYQSLINVLKLLSRAGS